VFFCNILHRYVELRIIKKDAGKTATVVIQRRSDNPARPPTAAVKPEPQPSALSRSLPVSRLGSFDDGANTSGSLAHAQQQRVPQANPAAAAAAQPRPAQAPAPIPDDHCGVGMMMAEEGGHLKVMGLVPGGPADKSHAIQKGDLLVEIDGKSVVGRSILDVRPSLLGARGSSITIGLARTPASRPVRITLIRDKPAAAKAAQPQPVQQKPQPVQQMPQPAGRSSCAHSFCTAILSRAFCALLMSAPAGIRNSATSKGAAWKPLLSPTRRPAAWATLPMAPPLTLPVRPSPLPPCRDVTRRVSSGESHRVKHERHESAPAPPPISLGSSAKSSQHKPSQQRSSGRR
jgi:hypothetical protein